MKKGISISIVGLQGNPETLLARAESIHRQYAEWYGDDIFGQFPTCPVVGPTFEQVIDFLEANNFRCVDVAGKADDPVAEWKFWTDELDFDSTEKVLMVFQSNLRFDAYVNLTVPTQDAKELAFDLMRSGLWHLVGVSTVKEI